MSDYRTGDWRLEWLFYCPARGAVRKTGRGFLANYLLHEFCGKCGLVHETTERVVRRVSMKFWYKPWTWRALSWWEAKTVEPPTRVYDRIRDEFVDIAKGEKKP